MALLGASGSGKSTFAREHFGPFEVLSSDFCRGLVSDDRVERPARLDEFEQPLALPLEQALLQRAEGLRVEALAALAGRLDQHVEIGQ